MQSLPKQLKPASRWFTRWAIGFALASSVFLAGNGSAQETGATQQNVQDIANDAFLIRQKLYDLYLTAWTTMVNTHGTGAITNFLGESSGSSFHSSIENDVAEAIRTALGFPPNGFNGYVSSTPYMYPYGGSKTVGEWAVDVFGGGGTYSDPAPRTNVLAYLQYILNAVDAPQDLSVSNLLTEQTTILSSNSTAIASVYEKLDALESPPSSEEIEESTDADTYTNAVPVSPLALGSVDVDTSSLESVLDPITDGLDGLIPTESTTKPKIVMMQQGNRSGGNVEVELNLDGLEAVTRILRVLYKVGLWVGVIGILRSEWAFWSTLGGSAT